MGRCTQETTSHSAPRLRTFFYWQAKLTCTKQFWYAPISDRPSRCRDSTIWQPCSALPVRAELYGYATNNQEMCSERDSPLEPFVLSAPGRPELARLTCGAHLGPPVLTRKQKRPRINSLVCDRAAAFCAAGLPEALSWMSRLVTQAAKRERELARAHSQWLKQATLSLALDPCLIYDLMSG